MIEFFELTKKSWIPTMTMCLFSFIFQSVCLLSISTSMRSYVYESNIDPENSECLISKPNISGIDRYEKYWQNVADQNGTIFRIWKAYYDDRPTIGNHVIRVLGTTDRYPAPSVKCIFWNGDDTIRIIHAEINPTFRPKYLLDHALQPILINCPIPESKIPESVSLMIGECSNASSVPKYQTC